MKELVKQLSSNQWVRVFAANRHFLEDLFFTDKCVDMAKSM